MFRVTHYPMISKTESGRIGYRKKYGVAGRVRVPAGHWLQKMFTRTPSKKIASKCSKWRWGGGVNSLLTMSKRKSRNGIVLMLKQFSFDFCSSCFDWLLSTTSIINIIDIKKWARGAMWTIGNMSNINNQQYEEYQRVWQSGLRCWGEGRVRVQQQLRSYRFLP